jgi:hypothetical protein
MDAKEILSEIIKYAPVAGSFFGAPGIAIGTAIKSIGGAFGLKEDADASTIIEAVKTDPEAALKMFNAQSLYNLEVMKQDNETLRIELQDVQSARNRQVEHEKVTGKGDTNLYVLAWTIVIGTFSLTAFLLYMSYAGVPMTDSTGALFMVLGGMIAAFTGVVQYFFGSSRGSREKTELMGQMRKQFVK